MQNTTYESDLHLGPSASLKTKSAVRLKYEAEIRSFRDRHGGLEDVRRKMGLSRRKMCELLMVDPSAWTRWCRDETRVPAHVYRSFEWLLLLNERGLAPDSHAQLRSMETRVKRLERMVVLSCGTAVITSVLLAAVFFI